MRRLSLFLVALIVFATSYGQENFMPNYEPVAPEAASLGKYAEHPVSYFTGTPDISIPLFEINTGRINVPITLSYHASGVRVEEIASRMGMGWTLNAGGVISRTVIGVPDEKRFFDAICGEGSCSDERGYYRIGNADIIDYLRTEPPDDPSTRDVLDTDLDSWFYNFSGRSGAFYIKEPGAASTDYIEPVLIDYAPIKFKRSLTSDGYFFEDFTIIDENGIHYIFDEVENQFIGSNCSRDYSNVKSSYYLSEIYDPITGKSVNFTYTTLVPSGGADFIHVETSGSQFFGGSDCTGPDNKISCAKSTSIYNAKVLSKITFDGGAIFFNSTSREDLDNDERYTSVEWYNNDLSSKVLLKKYEFTHNYAHITGNTGEKDKRLYLYGIKEKGSTGSTGAEYTFEYTSENLLPSRNSKEQDVWGFYNANGATTLEPTIYEYNSYLSFYETGGTILSTHSANDRSCNENTVTYGTLEKITYPTGGYTKFNFEPHVFDASEKGGGIRIASMEKNDGTNSVYSVFSYNNGNFQGGIPELAISPTSGSVRKFSNNQMNSGAVGYASVFEFIKDGTDANANSMGAVKYEYKTDQDTDVSVQVEDNCSGAYTYMSSTSSFPYHPKQSPYDSKRGLLEKVTYLDDDEQTPVRMIEHAYDYKIKGTVVLYSGAGSKKDGFRLWSTRYVRGIGEMTTQTKVTEYDDTNNPFVTITDYKYNDKIEQGSPVVVENLTLREETTDDSNGIRSKVTYKYPFDYTGSSVMTSMTNMNYISPAIEQRSYYVTETSELIKGSVVTEFASFNLGSRSAILPGATYVAKIDSPHGTGGFPEMTDPSVPTSIYETRQEVISYDGHAQPTEIQYDGHTQFMLWSSDGVLLENVETNSTDDDYILSPSQNWDEVSCSDALTGNTCWMDSQQEGEWTGWSFSSDSYLTFWAKGGAFGIVDFGTNEQITVNVPDEWTFYAYKLDAADWDDPYMYGTSKLDEVRLTKGAPRISTYEYDEFNRIKSTNDWSNNIATYVYDSFGRLYQVLDKDKNVLKEFKYNYQ